MMFAIAAIVALSMSWAVSPRQAPSSPPQPKPDIRLEAGCEVVSGQGVNAFTVTLRNASGGDTAVTLGIALGNGNRYEPTNISAHIDGGDGADDFQYSAGAIGGRVDPWFVPLPRGAMYRVRVPVHRMISSRSLRMPDLRDAKGPFKARVILDARPISFTNGGFDSLALMRLTVARIESAVLELPQACVPGAAW